MDLQGLNTEQKRQALADMAQGGCGRVFGAIYETDYKGRHYFAIDTPWGTDITTMLCETYEQAQCLQKIGTLDI